MPKKSVNISCDHVGRGRSYYYIWGKAHDGACGASRPLMALVANVATVVPLPSFNKRDKGSTNQPIEMPPPPFSSLSNENHQSQQSPLQHYIQGAYYSLVGQILGQKGHTCVNNGAADRLHGRHEPGCVLDTQARKRRGSQSFTKCS